MRSNYQSDVAVDGGRVRRARYFFSTGTAPPRQQIVLDNVRLTFEPQDRPSEFAAHAPGIEVEMRATGVTLNGRRIQLAGANPAASATAEDALPGRSNYYLGAEPRVWRVAVPHCARTRYRNVYRTIDGKPSGGAELSTI